MDANLGRVDITMLSDQNLVELLVEGFNDEAKKRYQDENGDFLEVCQWPRFRCDDDGRVIHIESWNEIQISGTIDLRYLPPKCEYTKFEALNLSGTLDTTLLPSCMTFFNIEQNDFHGSVDFNVLPRRMKSFDVSFNRFTGSVALDRLPDTLEYLHIFDNHFSGTLCLTKLPQALHNLAIMDNAFTGNLHLENTQNTISVYAGRNKFEPTAVIQKDSGFVYLEDSGVESVFDEFGGVHKEMGARISFY